VTGASPERPELRTARVRAIAGALTIAFAAALALDLARVSPLAEMCFDAYQRLSPRPVTSLPETIVAIDDASLEKLGRWPWPRTLLATLVRKVAAFSPGAIGLDIVMPEADPLSPARAFAHVDVDAALRARIDAMPSNDADLAAALRATPSVLAMVGTVEPTAEPLRVTPILVGGARGEALRQVFLDRDLAADHRFFGEIGDAEAARAEQAQDAVAVERVPDRQGVDVGVRQGSLRQNPESFPGAAKIKRNARPLNAHLRSRSP